MHKQNTCIICKEILWGHRVFNDHTNKFGATSDNNQIKTIIKHAPVTKPTNIFTILMDEDVKKKKKI